VSSRKLLLFVAARVEAAPRPCLLLLRSVLFAILFGLGQATVAAILVSPALAAPAGDAWRKELCDEAVVKCMRANLPLNPPARTEIEKTGYCAQFFAGCMSRSINPDRAWYSPETVARFLMCPS
jgi:hypothetical protein